MEEGGKVDTTEHLQRLKNQRKKERLAQPKRTRIYVPSQFDVLFGKGTPFQDHVGNIKFRSLIADCSKEYDNGNQKGGKMTIAQDIVDTVRESSGMFLKCDEDGSWVDVDNLTARKKVSTAFRTLRGYKDGRKSEAKAKISKSSSNY